MALNTHILTPYLLFDIKRTKWRRSILYLILRGTTSHNKALYASHAHCKAVAEITLNEAS